MRLIFFFIILLLLSSCLSKVKQRAIVTTPPVVFEVDLKNKPNYCNAQNVFFSREGTYFGTKDSSISYLVLDSIPELSSQFNISFWFKFEGNNGKISQTLFKAFNAQNPKDELLRIWVSGQRVTGSVNSEKFTSHYEEENSFLSRNYYDLPKLEKGKYYFLSVNRKENSIALFINSELYEEYNLKKENHSSINTIIFGVSNTEGQYVNQLYGAIRNLKIFEQPLSEDEIYSISTEEYDEIFEFNDAFELSKFNLED